MMTKTIKISQKNYELLSELASKNETFDEVIDFLINYYEEFSCKEADFYNKEIEKFEKDNLENISEVTLKKLEQRISKLENELKN